MNIQSSLLKPFILILFCFLTLPIMLVAGKDGEAPKTKGEAKFSLKDSVIYLPKNAKSFQLQLKGTFSSHWGIYGLTPVVDEDGFGPQATEITISPDSLFTIGKNIKSGKSSKHYDPEYKMDVEKFKEKADFTIPITLNVKPNTESLTGKISILYQLCADASCTTPNDYKQTFTVVFKPKPKVSKKR